MGANKSKLKEMSDNRRLEISRTIDEIEEINVGCCCCQKEQLSITNSLVKNIVFDDASSNVILKDWHLMSLQHRIRFKQHFYFLSIPEEFWMDYMNVNESMVDIVIFVTELVVNEKYHRKEERRLTTIQSIQVLLSLAAETNVRVIVAEVSLNENDDEQTLLSYPSVVDWSSFNDIHSVQRMNVVNNYGISKLVDVLREEGERLINDNGKKGEEVGEEEQKKRLDLDLPPNWYESYDEQENATYYYNSETQESVWERPSSKEVAEGSSAERRSLLL
jgi:hypothetical protein